VADASPRADVAQPSAAARAAAQVEATREDPAGRIALLTVTYHGPYGDAPQHLPFRRAALSFMRWQVNRGVLNSLDAEPPGSRWWRAVNERLLRDGCEAVARSGGFGGDPSSSTIEFGTAFIAQPTARNWYRAHNASVVAAYLEHRHLASEENEVERFFLNVVLLRVLYAHALAAAPRLSLGRFAPLGKVLGDPRLGMAGIFLSLSRVLPDRYPAAGRIDQYIDMERRVGRLLDYGVIGPRLQLLYQWAARELDQPALLSLIRDGSPVYSWPFAQRQVWRPAHRSAAVRLLGRLTSPR
jgi:hypothetical protein